MEASVQLQGKLILYCIILTKDSDIGPEATFRDVTNDQSFSFWHCDRLWVILKWESYNGFASSIDTILVWNLEGKLLKLRIESVSLDGLLGIIE